MSINGQGHYFTIYFPGFVLYKATISGERLQDHWSSGFKEVCHSGCLIDDFIQLFCFVLNPYHLFTTATEVELRKLLNLFLLRVLFLVAFLKLPEVFYCLIFVINSF